MNTQFDWARTLAEMSNEDRIKAAQLTLQRFNYAANYWNPYFVKGRECQRYLVGDILSKEEIEEFESQDKLAVQVPEALPKINAIIGMLSDTAKDGVVVANQGEDAAGSDVVNIILKAIERDNRLRRKELQAAQDTIVTSVPTWMWMDGYDPYDPEEVGLNLDLQPWDSVLVDPAWRDPQLRDIRFIQRIKQLSLEQIEETYPDASHTLATLSTSDPIVFNYITADATERNSLNERVRESREAYSRTGLINVIEMLSWVRRNTSIWFSESTGETHIPPATWTEEQKQEWVSMNPGFVEITSRERILWVHTVTMSGELLASGPHWLQIGRLPCVPYVAGVIDNQFVGLLEFSRATLKAGVYAKSEWIHSIRTGNNNLWKVHDGAVSDIEEFQDQRTRPGGTIVVSAGADMDEVQKVENSNPQNAYMDWKQNEEDTLARLLVERNFEGGMQTSQESAKAISARIQQVISRLSPLVYGWHEFRMNLRRLLVKAIPYTYTFNKVFRYMDPSDGMVVAEVNKEVQDIGNNITHVLNNLNGADYDYIETEADNSVTGSEHERMIFREFMESYGNMLPEVIAEIAMSYPSTTVQKFGRSLKEKQENQTPPTPADNAKLNISLDATALGGNLMAQKIATKVGLLEQSDIESSGAQPMQDQMNSGLPQSNEQLGA